MRQLTKLQYSESVDGYPLWNPCDEYLNWDVCDEDKVLRLQSDVEKPLNSYKLKCSTVPSTVGSPSLPKFLIVSTVSGAKRKATQYTHLRPSNWGLGKGLP